MSSDFAMLRAEVALMRKWFFGLIVFGMLLGQLVQVGGALAAPSVVVSPASGPRGTAIGVSAAGLVPGQTYLVQLVRGTGNVNTVRVFEGSAQANERGELHYRLAVDQEPGDYTVRIVAIGGTVVATAPFTVTPGGPPGDARHFPETGQTVRGRFLAYWTSHGLDLGDPGISYRESLALFGYPISDEFEQTLENGRAYTVQYFERARMEYHPEHAGTPHEVLLGQFGRRIVATVPGAPTAPVPPSSQSGALHFPETGHNVGPPFSTFWLRNGGLAVFGYPLSEPFTQTLEDGKAYTVQYFERARMEQHPAQEGMPYNIQLGQFGRRIFDSYPGEPLYQIGIYLSDEAPQRGGEVTLTVAVGRRYEPVADFRLESVWHFPSGPRRCDARAGASGEARCTLNIGNTPAGVAVAIDATAILPDGTRLEAARVSFTPR
jgi:hypothetical protein